MEEHDPSVYPLSKLTKVASLLRTVNPLKESPSKELSLLWSMKMYCSCLNAGGKSPREMEVMALLDK